MHDRKQQFEKLMMLYLSESITDNEERALLVILDSDPNYKVRYDEMLKTRAISLIPAIESRKTANYKQFIHLITNSFSLNKRLGFMPTFIRVAAIIVFVLSTSVSAYYIVTDFNAGNNMLSYETVVPHGSQTKIVLPDGTIAWLNSGSILKYSNNYGSKNRTVYLTGEGYFDVQRNPKKPFLVYANDIKVKVLGTVFNVRAYNDEATVEVNLIEGKVDISSTENKASQVLSLKPNEKMVFNKQHKTIRAYKVDASRAATWTTGKLCFVDASLEDIAKDLERKYDVQIDIKAKNIKDELFSGSLDLNQPIGNVLKYLDVDKKYKVEVSANTINISDKK
jgi:ferric-dicitrate binding protein FerR (iron transport regulator)